MARFSRVERQITMPTLAVPKEPDAGEHRVALVPLVLPNLIEAGFDITIEAGAGMSAHITDAEYSDRGAAMVADRAELLAGADVVATVRGLLGGDGFRAMRAGAALVGLLDPLANPAMRELAEHGLTAFAMELMPRITRAQSMDALSSMATLAGYRAVILAAQAVPRLFPLMMTAAGTLTASRVFVLGAGVAGLQAIATARRLGAVVDAYDVRPAVKEQVESLGANFVALELEAGQAEDAGGYATAQAHDFYERQEALLSDRLSQADAVITTALVPGRDAPKLISAASIERMRPGAVIVDLAAERGGNSELTEPGRTVERFGVTIIGPIQLAAEVPVHASQMYARNISSFVQLLIRDGELTFDQEDEIVRSTLVAHRGELVNPMVRKSLGEA